MIRSSTRVGSLRSVNSSVQNSVSLTKCCSGHTRVAGGGVVRYGGSSLKYCVTRSGSTTTEQLTVPSRSERSPEKGAPLGSKEPEPIWQREWRSVRNATEPSFLVSRNMYGVWSNAVKSCKSGSL